MASASFAAMTPTLPSHVLCHDLVIRPTQVPKRLLKKRRSSRCQPAPDTRQPGLLFAWQAGRAIVVSKLNEPGGRHIAAPSFEIMIRAVAAAGPAFLVMAGRGR